MSLVSDPHAPRRHGLRGAFGGALFATLLSLVACGGGDGDGSGGSTAPPPTGGGSVTPGTPAAARVDVTGVAATGAAIANATVTAVNARGDRATATTGADGRFTVSVIEGGPYLLSVTDASNRTWYSYAAGAGTAHLTPLTTLALLQANGNRPLADLLANWATSRLTDAQVLEAAKVVNANLASVMQSRGVAATSTNVFNASFSANGQGLDAVLDALRVSIACTASACTQTITNPAGQVVVTWNANIATNGYTVSWSGGGSSGTVDIGVGSCRAPQAGTYSLIVQTSVSGLGVGSIPEVCVDGLPGKPASQAEFCGSATVNQQLPPGVQIVSCSFEGNSGTISARITTPVTVDYTVRYTFVQR